MFLDHNTHYPLEAIRNCCDAALAPAGPNLVTNIIFAAVAVVVIGVVVVVDVVDLARCGVPGSEVAKFILENPSWMQHRQRNALKQFSYTAVVVRVCP